MQLHCSPSSAHFGPFENATGPSVGSFVGERDVGTNVCPVVVGPREDGALLGALVFGERVLGSNVLGNEVVGPLVTGDAVAFGQQLPDLYACAKG